MEDGNDIVLEEHILRELSFRGGIAGTTGVLVDCDKLNGPSVTKKFKSRIIGTRSTHEIRWYEDKIDIYESSEITDAEVILDERLKLHQKNNLDVSVEKNICIR